MPRPSKRRIGLTSALFAGLLAVGAPTPGHAEGDRAVDGQLARTNATPAAPSVTRPAKPANQRAARSGTPRTKPPPQHRRDFGYSGFVGKSF